MKLKAYSLLTVICLGLFSNLMAGKNSTTGNIGFENGNFSGWKGYVWVYSTAQPSINTSESIVTLPSDRRHVIMSDTSAYDSNTGNLLKIIPKGYKYAARIGDAIRADDISPRCWQQAIRYQLSVDSTNALLVMKFACVLQYSSSHDNVTEFEPRFRFSLLDANGNKITSVCANYDVYSTNTTVKGFQKYTPAGSTTPVMWRDWTTVGANLLDYIGQTITIEFMSADCTGHYHYGYAYCVAETHPMIITVQYCSGDSKARLIAPEGFETYMWKDDKGMKIDSAQILEVDNPDEGKLYYCSMNSATGCEVTLSSKVHRYEPNADFKYDLVDCNKLTNTLKFSNLYPAINGYLTYNWDFGDGSTGTSDTITHSFTTSGLHPVKLIVSNPPSVCADTVIKKVETFYPPMVGISGDSLYCLGEKTTLKGFGAYRYQWSDGSTADSILIGKDTTIWMIGYSSAGCYTDTIRKTIKAAPDWNFNLSGKTMFCKGDSTVLIASNAESYSWNTNATTKLITIKKPGIYTVTGTNEYGCSKTIITQVDEIPLPETDFSVSATTVDERHNSITCVSAAQNDVKYVWKMGDGTTLSGSNITHSYKINNQLPEYIISLTAINADSCINSLSKSVKIVPFVPNFFSPNGDGVNNLFLSGLHLTIYDRYGLKLYEGTDGWDGTCKGRKMDNDTYYYTVNYTDVIGELKTLKGYVVLKR
jgi:gliding motility-associated-like protein